MSSPSVSQSIRALYEAYPYPTRIPGGSADPFLEYIRAFSANPRQGTPAFLDAGCGTGLNIFGGAAIYPHFQVYGCDLNRVALEQIAGEAQALGLANLHVKEMDLLHLDPEFGPAEGFDVIYSTGVIHHTSDPLGILKSLAGRLAPQGVLRLMVYGKKGREDLYRFAEVARKLYGHLPWPQQVAAARSLMTELDACHRARTGMPPAVARGPWEDALRTDDIEFADRYLNPHDQPFTVESLKTLFEQAGLEFLQWFEPRDWDLASLLPEQRKLPDDLWEQFAIIENLFDRPMLDLYLVHPGFQKRTITLTPQTVIGLNPQCFLNCYKARGMSYHRIAQLRLGGERTLTRDEGNLLESIGLRFLPASAMIAELPHPDQEYWMPVVERLLAEEYLFAPHAS